MYGARTGKRRTDINERAEDRWVGGRVGGMRVTAWSCNASSSLEHFDCKALLVSSSGAARNILPTAVYLSSRDTRRYTEYETQASCSHVCVSGESESSSAIVRRSCSSPYRNSFGKSLAITNR